MNNWVKKYKESHRWTAAFPNLGRSLVASRGWAGLGLVFVKSVHPCIDKKVELLDHKVSKCYLSYDYNENKSDCFSMMATST